MNPLENKDICKQIINYLDITQLVVLTQVNKTIKNIVLDTTTKYSIMHDSKHYLVCNRESDDLTKIIYKHEKYIVSDGYIYQ